jgi:hypothetical protein
MGGQFLPREAGEGDRGRRPWWRGRFPKRWTYRILPLRQHFVLPPPPGGQGYRI